MSVQLTNANIVSILGMALVGLASAGVSAEEATATAEEVTVATAAPIVESQPNAGFDPDAFTSFYIQDSTGQYRLSIGAYAQVRYEVNHRSGEPAEGDSLETGWNLNRARLFFEGRYTDSFDYRIAVNVDAEGDADFQQAYFKYYFADVWQIWVGEQYYNSMREDWPDPTLTSSMDNSAVDYTFALGTAFGAMLHRAPVGKTRWWFAVTNGAFGSQRVFAEDEESDIMVFGRVDYQLFGTDWSVWDDLIGAPGLPFGVMLGFSPGYMVLDSDTPGESENITQMNADLSINGDGYNILLAGVWNHRSPEGAPSFNNYGMYLQAGYFFTSKWQGYARYDLVSPGNEPGDLESYSAPGIGVNFFPLSNRRWRFSAELNHLFSTLNNTIVAPNRELGWLPSDSSGQTSFRIQTQFGF
jgi:hypothetical protein